MNIQRLLFRPRIFRNLTGLNPEEFKVLVKRLSPMIIEQHNKQLNNRRRKRAIGAGSKFKLNTAQTLFMLLLYYRTYTNHIFIGMIMGIDDSNVCRYFRRIEPLLAQIFRIPEKKIELSQEEILELIIDATEQETQNRKGSGYSGKKKKRTIKTQILVDKKGKVKSVSKSVRGNKHDKKLYDETRLILQHKDRQELKKFRIYGDLGYIGIKRIKTPIKKKPNENLTKKQKQFNQKFNAKRFVVEHTFAHLKNFRILQDRFRNKLKHYNLIFKNVVGLHNLMLQT